MLGSVTDASDRQAHPYPEFLLFISMTCSINRRQAFLSQVTLLPICYLVALKISS